MLAIYKEALGFSKMTDPIDVTGEVISPDHQNITPLFMRHMAVYRYFAGFIKGKKTLEVGFGEGYGSYYLADVAKDLTGMDVSQALLEHARTKYDRKNLYFIKGDATSIPFSEGSMEVVVSSQVLEHVKDYMRSIREVHRVLAPGGIALIATPNRKAMLDGVNPYHYKEFSAGELETALRKVFREVTVAGLFGSARYMEIKAAEQGYARKLLDIDFLRLRRLVPRAVIKPFYKMAFEAVNRRTEGASKGASITIDDFRVDTTDADKSLDLIGVCKK